MKRDDWVFVGIRLIGLYVVAAVLLNLSGLWYMSSSPEGMRWTNAAVLVGLPLGTGLVLFLGAPAIVRWLAFKDRRGEEYARRVAEERAKTSAFP